MKLSCPLIAVKDLERSKAFYRALFDQEVVMDLGWNVTLSGGFALQEHFDRLLDIPEETIVYRGNDMELYFEVEDFDAFLAKLDSHPEVERVHPVKTYNWKQRVARVYDPDGHIIEIGESMAVIARRYLAQGYSVEETAQIIQHPVGFVASCAE